MGCACKCGKKSVRVARYSQVPLYLNVLEKRKKRKRQAEAESARK
jgi:hypothetical protein